MTTSFASIVNLGGLREALRIRTGLPEDGDSGKTRANRVLNYALREFFGDLPQMFEREECRFQLGAKYDSSTLELCPSDARCFRLTSTDTTLLPTSGILVGRWIDITDFTGKVHRKRICNVATINTTTLWGSGGSRNVVIVDTPWHDLTANRVFAYAAFTLDYPLPPDWREVADVYRLDASSSPRLLTHVFPEEMERVRISQDWLAEGTPEVWTRGDFAQIRAPHDTPVVAIVAGGAGAAVRWGYNAGNPHDNGGAFLPAYEAAGTFKYCYCLGWGSLDLTPFFRDLDQDEPALTQYMPRPFYLSAPSPTSAEVTAAWGTGAVQINSVDQGAVQAYVGNLTSPTYRGTGLQKWWFRARVANDTSTSPTVPNVEADGEFYLWRVTPADDTSSPIYDKGADGAPIVTFPLKEFAGHQTIRFNRIPGDANTTVIVRGRRLPDRLKYDSDMARCPSDCTDAIVYLAASILTGERAADMKKALEYRGLYEGAVKKLRRKYAIASGRPTPAGSIEGDTHAFVGVESPIVAET